MTAKRELIIGIDDAGRGPIIGPMILAGVLITKEQEKILREAGVKDSKQVTQKRREFLSNIIKNEVNGPYGENKASNSSFLYENGKFPTYNFFT